MYNAVVNIVGIKLDNIVIKRLSHEILHFNRDVQDNEMAVYL